MGYNSHLSSFHFIEQLLGFYRKENKIKGLDNRNLKKTLQGTDSFLAMLCGKIAIGYKKKNDVINTLAKEMKEKEATVKVCLVLKYLNKKLYSSRQESVSDIKNTCQSNTFRFILEIEQSH